MERKLTDACYAIRNADVREATAITERRIADAGYAIANCDARQATATIEHISTDAYYSIGNGDAREATAIIEHISADACYTIRKCDARQATAIGERRMADARYAVKNLDTLNATTISERIIADACATCDYHSFQRGGNIVIIGRIRVCTQNVSKMRIFRTIFGCSHKWNRDARKATATFECTRADASHAIGNHNVRQACAI